MPVVSLTDASAAYDGAAVLRGVTLTIEDGEKVAIMGRSGAGKTTLINLIYSEVAEHAALIPQAASLVRPLSVFHNVYMGRLDRHSAWRNLRTLARPSRSDVADIRATLGLVDLEDAIFAKAGRLSGGQQQRVSVARALYNGRPVVIGDEPVSALDRVQGAAILRRICTRVSTAIVVLHDIQLALGETDRVVMLDGGRVVLDAPTARLTAADLLPIYGL